MSKDIRLGILFFSSVVAIGFGNFLNPGRWALRRSLTPLQQDGQDGQDNNNSNKNSVDTIGRKGNLILYGTNNYNNNNWKTVRTITTNNKECQIEIINNYNEPVILCWINTDGKLYGYRPINDGSIRDGSVTNRHTEYTSTNHAFVCFRQTEKLPNHLEEITENLFLFCYVPTISNHRHIITLSKVNKKGFPLSIFNRTYQLCITLDCKLPDAVIDSTKKEYKTRIISGFTINYEPGVFELISELETALVEDFCMLQQLLPEKACKKLQIDTPVWINESLTYGSVKNPIIGRSMTFHPNGGADWLINMGMTPKKEGCIEIFSAKDYVENRKQKLWGTGGVIVHEFSHAFHNKHCPDGFDCEEIREAYTIAMKKCLYDKVAVHGRQGANGPVKAYACANCMEFFAELSTAYMWKEDESTEYNKWFPFNRYQLAQHDPHTYQVINKYWSV